MAIEKEIFRRVMGYFVTGITVVTTKCQERLVGMTASSFSSVSLNPPLILICVDRASATCHSIHTSEVFAVNILTKMQEGLSRCFATSSLERYEDFCHASYRIAATGAPIIDDTLAFLDAKVVAEYPGGDHLIFLGQVIAMGIAGQVVFAHEADREHITVTKAEDNKTDQGPLAYYLGQYCHPSSSYRKPGLPAPAAYIHRDSSLKGQD